MKMTSIGQNLLQKYGNELTYDNFNISGNTYNVLEMCDKPLY